MNARDEHPELTDLVYTPAEVMALLKVSRSQVYEMLRSGDLPATKVGRMIRIARADLLAYLTRHDAH